jgi:hypothetical protein
MASFGKMRISQAVGNHGERRGERFPLAHPLQTFQLRHRPEDLPLQFRFVALDSSTSTDGSNAAESSKRAQLIQVGGAVVARRVLLVAWIISLSALAFPPPDRMPIHTAMEGERMARNDFPVSHEGGLIGG